MSEKFETEYSKAVKEWKDTKDFRRALDVTTLGGTSQYLENRLQNAFEAGWNARPPTPEAASDWIEIKSDDDLPKESGEYLATIDTINVGLRARSAYYAGHFKMWNLLPSEVKVLAYRPLPSPYSPETANGKEKNDE